MGLSSLNIKYKPLEIKNDLTNIDSTSIELEKTSEQELIDESIANKLLDHLNLIQQFNDRIKAIDYLIDNAEKKAGNPIYYTSNEDLIRDIIKLGGKGNKIDFELFKKTVLIVINGYKQMALVSITGANND